MKLGLCSSDFASAKADILFGKMAEYGAETTQFAFASAAEFEFVPDSHIELPERFPASAMNAVVRASEKTGVKVGTCNGTFNMTSADEEVRAEGLRRFPAFAEAAKALGASYISLCSGTRSGVSLWTYHPGNAREDAWRDMMESMKRVTEVAERLNVTLAIETEASNVIDTPEKARRVMDEIGSDKLKMILDAANLFPRSGARAADVHATLEKAFDLFGKDVVLAHGKDIRENDHIDFCAAGEGVVDFPLMVKLLRKVGFDGDFLLHGIYDEAKMPGCMAMIGGILRENA